MSKNKVIIYSTILITIFLIFVPSVYKTIKQHNDRLLAVTTKKIIETAKSCYYNESCIEEKITLNELYEKTELKELINPLTKKVYNSESYVDVKDNFAFVEK